MIESNGSQIEYLKPAVWTPPGNFLEMLEILIPEYTHTNCQLWRWYPNQSDAYEGLKTTNWNSGFILT